MFFRLSVLFFTAASLVLAVWSIVGSYKNASHLTDNYLFGFQLSNLNFSEIIKEANLKRDLSPQLLAAELLLPTPTTDEVLHPRDVVSSLASALNLQTSQLVLLATAETSELVGLVTSVASDVNTGDIGSLISSFATATNQLDQLKLLASEASIPESLATLASELGDDLDSLVSELISEVSVSDLGLADYYSIGYWGYCRGGIGEDEVYLDSLGRFGKQFNNQHINFTYCSPPKAGYKLDPLSLLKHELMNLLAHKIDGISDLIPSKLSEDAEVKLLSLINSVTYEDLGLPGELKTLLDLLHRLTVASFALILTGACLAFISFAFQLFGLFCSPENSCLSCLSFLLMVFVFLLTLIGSAMSTGVFIFVRKEVNNEVRQYGVRGWLSVQYYAFLWSSAVASLVMLVVAFIGYCCGCFHPGKRGRKQDKGEHHEPDMHYDHTYNGTHEYKG